MKSKILFSLVIPCYNEESNLEDLVKRCNQFLNTNYIEVIFVDNGSTDNSNKILKKLLKDIDNFKLIKIKTNQGYGNGIIEGLNSCSGDFIGWTHADLQTDPKDFLQSIKLIEENTSRNLFVKGIRYGRPIRDSIFTWGMSFIELILLNKWLWDINAQPNVFHKSFFKNLSDCPKDFSLDLYFFYKAKEQNLNIKRFPVYFGPRKSGIGHNEKLSDKIRFVRRIMLYSLKLRSLLKDTYNAKNSSQN